MAFALLLLTGGCWRHSEGGGEERQLSFDCNTGGGTRVEARAGRPGEPLGPVAPVYVSWQEARQNPFAAGLHSGGGWQYRTVPIEVVEAHCDPATLCEVTVQPNEVGAKLLLHGRTVGEGKLVVHARRSWWRSVSDRIPVKVVPPRS
jgi:hypothetical protein